MDTPRTADEWAEKRRASKQTPQEEAAFKAWMEANPANAAEYEVAETFAKLPRFFRHFSPDPAVHAFDEVLRPPQSPRSSEPADGSSSSKAKARGALWLSGIALVTAVAVIWNHLA